MTQTTNKDQSALDESQEQLNQAQAAQAQAQADLAIQQANQARYDALVPDLTKVTAPALNAGQADGGVASALAFVAMKRAAEKASRGLSAKLGDMSAAKILLTCEPNLIKTSSAGLDVASELQQLSGRADDLTAKAASPSSGNGSGAGDGGPHVEEHILPVTVLGAVAAALPGVLSLFAKHETIGTAAVATDDLAAVAAVAGALVNEKKSPMVKLDIFQRAVRGDLYNQADALGGKLAALRLLPNQSKEVTDLITLIENTLTAIVSVPSGGTSSPLAEANFWNASFGGIAPMTHILLVKSETGGTAEMVDQRAVFADKVFLAATASISYMLIDASSVIVASGVESATAQLYGNIHDVLKSSVVE